MATVQHAITRTRAIEEANGSFATSQIGSIGSFTEIPIIEGTGNLTLNYEVLPVSHSQQHIDGMSEKVLGIKTWQYSFQINLQTVDTKATDGVTIAQGPLGLLLKVGMGGERLGVGDTFAVSAGTNGFDVTTGARWEAGAAIGGTTGGGDAFEVRVIASISSNTVTLKHDFSNTTVSAENAYAAATYYLETGGGDVITSAQFAVEGLEADDRWLRIGILSG